MQKPNIKKSLAKISKIFSNKSFEYLYNSGIDAYKKKNFKKAVRYFNSAIEKSNLRPQAYYNLALTYQSMKQKDRAIINYNKFLRLNPEDYDGLYNIGLIYYDLKNYDKAINYFEKCVRIKYDEDGIKSLIMAYLDNNELQKALEFAARFSQAGQYSNSKMYYAIAKMFENKNLFNKNYEYIDEAIKMYLKIIENEPDFFEVYLSISICYAKKADFNKSLEFCEKALEKNPRSYDANNQMGLIYYCCNNMEKSVNYYEIALSLKSDDYKIYSNLGYAYEKSGKNDKAVTIFTQLIKKFPDFPAKDEIKNHLRILKKL